MKKIRLAVCAFAVSTFAVAAAPSFAMELSEIIAKNSAARGGSDAWRKIDTIIFVGHIESERMPGGLPFVLEMKRPDKTRFEIRSPEQHSLRVFDGNMGWKLRPAKAGAPVVQPYSKEEIDFARDESEIGGPLLNLDEKSAVLDAMEMVDGKEAYRLKLRMPTGATRHVWVDAGTFLDVRYDRPGQDDHGRSFAVDVDYRDFRRIDGLLIPFRIESGKDALVIDRVVLNPFLPDKLFSKPGARF